MKIIRSSRLIKSRYIGMVDDLSQMSTGSFFEKGRLYFYGHSGESEAVYSDELPLPDYDFLTRRSSYFLEKKSVISLYVSVVWHQLAIECLKKYLIK